MRKIYPVVLSGGSGTRLWPLSRRHFPKQLLALSGDRTLLQRTILRVAAEDLFHMPLVLANAEHRFVVAEQIREIGAAVRSIVLEPVGRNTAPAVAVAALLLLERDADAIMAVLPSDHLVEDQLGFEAAIELAAEAARRGVLVAFGIPPTGPCTEYGYLRRGGPLEGTVGCFRIASFVEKPDEATARRFLAAGDYAWNSGMFVLAAATYIKELERLRPDILAASRAAVGAARRDLDFLRLDEAAFEDCPAQSIDRAVMERTDRGAVIPVDLGWRDLGSWSALWELGDKDPEGNVVHGDVVLADVSDSYVRGGDGRLVAAVGVEGLVIVATADAVLVTPKSRGAEIKNLVAHLEASGREEIAIHRRVYRPWGYYQEIDAGPRYRAKRIVVRPGAGLSLQRHARRAEHWIVVRGTARITRGERIFTLGADESTYIPLGEIHRLENPGTEPLHLIEVQTGDYLGEDDIERFDDRYGRS